MKTKEYLNMVTGEIYFQEEYKKLAKEEKQQTIPYERYKQLKKKYRNERKKIKKWLTQHYNGGSVAMNKMQRLYDKVLKMQKYVYSDMYQTINFYL